MDRRTTIRPHCILSHPPIASSMQTKNPSRQECGSRKTRAWVCQPLDPCHTNLKSAHAIRRQQTSTNDKTICKKKILVNTTTLHGLISRVDHDTNASKKKISARNENVSCSDFRLFPVVGWHVLRLQRARHKPKVSSYQGGSQSLPHMSSGQDIFGRTTSRLESQHRSSPQSGPKSPTEQNGKPWKIQLL